MTRTSMARTTLLLAFYLTIATATTQTHYFELTVRIVPDILSALLCAPADQHLIGEAINNILLPEDDTVFLAGVCPTPTTGVRRQLRRRGYVWRGGGGCQSCYRDNADHRSRKLLGALAQLATTVVSAAATSVTSPYVGFEDTLGRTIASEIASNQTLGGCLGVAPQIVVVTTEIQLSNLNLVCDEDIGALQHFSSWGNEP